MSVSWRHFWHRSYAKAHLGEMVGALAFMASDAILSADLFAGARLARSERLSGYAIWALYYGGQAAIAIGLMGLDL